MRHIKDLLFFKSCSNGEAFSIALSALILGHGYAALSFVPIVVAFICVVISDKYDPR